MQYLKEDTAALIMFGVFVDKTDGVTLKTDATTITDIDHATTGIFLSKNGAAAAIRHATVTASAADAYGMMQVTLDATDTSTPGTLDVLFAKAATYLPVHKSFMVLPGNVYDFLMGTDLLDVNTAQWLGTAVTLSSNNKPDVNIDEISDDTTAPGNLELMFDGTGYAGGTAKLNVNVAAQDNIDFSTTQKTSIGTAVETQLTVANTELATVPPSTSGIRLQTQFVFEEFRHKKTQNKDTGVETLFKAGVGAAALGTATHDDNGTIVTRGEMN